MEWQERALGKILTETGGWKVAAMNDPDIEKWTLLYLIRLRHKNLNLVYGGGYERTGCPCWDGPRAGICSSCMPKAQEMCPAQPSIEIR